MRVAHADASDQLRTTYDALAERWTPWADAVRPDQCDPGGDDGAGG